MGGGLVHTDTECGTGQIRLVTSRGCIICYNPALVTVLVCD